MLQIFMDRSSYCFDWHDHPLILQHSGMLHVETLAAMHSSLPTTQQKAHLVAANGRCLTLTMGRVQVVYEWAQGTAFEDICKLTDVQEGIIVRTIVRLDETCREFRDAARVMGNTQLFQQMSEASAAIKRDVIFAASLYVA